MRKTLLTGRYYNCGDCAVAIVASITKDIDWAAYIGASVGTMSEAETVKYVKDWGCKLPEGDAKYYFPYVELPYRR